jgi:hypothetical protein
MEMRGLLAAVVVGLTAASGPAQFYPYNAAADGTQVGIGYDAAGQHAAVKPANGSPVMLADPPNLTNPAGYAISADGKWAGGNAGGWYTNTSGGSMFTSYSLQPVRWNVAANTAEVLAVPNYTYYATVDVLQPDGSAVGRAYTWFGMQALTWPASVTTSRVGGKAKAAPVQPFAAGPVVPHHAVPGHAPPTVGFAPQSQSPQPMPAYAPAASGGCGCEPAVAPQRRGLFHRFRR